MRCKSTHKKEHPQKSQVNKHASNMHQSQSGQASGSECRCASHASAERWCSRWRCPLRPCHPAAGRGQRAVPEAQCHRSTQGRRSSDAAGGQRGDRVGQGHQQKRGRALNSPLPPEKSAEGEEAEGTPKSSGFTARMLQGRAVAVGGRGRHSVIVLKGAKTGQGPKDQEDPRLQAGRQEAPWGGPAAPPEAAAASLHSRIPGHKAAGWHADTGAEAGVGTQRQQGTLPDGRPQW